jgi:hypothetical protein
MKHYSQLKKPLDNHVCIEGTNFFSVRFGYAGPFEMLHGLLDCPVKFIE